jgi:hypothetical protein
MLSFRLQRRDPVFEFIQLPPQRLQRFDFRINLAFWISEFQCGGLKVEQSLCSRLINNKG